MQLSAALRNTMADAITTAIGATGRARFYNAGLATVLASAACNNPAFDPAAAGAVALDTVPAVEDTGPLVAGTCVRLGFYTSTAATANAFVIMLGVNPTGTPDITMANNVIATSDTVAVSSLSLTVPEGTPDVT